MIPVKKLKALLEQMPDDAQVNAYEGEDTGLLIKKGDASWWIRAREGEEEDHKTIGFPRKKENLNPIELNPGKHYWIQHVYGGIWRVAYVGVDCDNELWMHLADRKPVAINTLEPTQFVCEEIELPGKLSASEAIFGFCGWLISRKKITFMTSPGDAAPIDELVRQFCNENKLADPGERWETNLIHPSGECSVSNQENK